MLFLFRRSEPVGKTRARVRPAVGRGLEQLESRELMSAGQLTRALVDAPPLSLMPASGQVLRAEAFGGLGVGASQPGAVHSLAINLNNSRGVDAQLSNLTGGLITNARGVVALPIRGINLTFPSVNISLPGVGPVPTGPITATLQRGKPSFALFDTKTGVVFTQQFLRFDFPLLSQINSPAPTVLFKEAGIGTTGINPRTRQVVMLGNLSGGGVFDPGSVLANTIMLVNDSTNIFAATPPALPATPTPDTPYPNPVQPFPSGTLPDARALPPGFVPATPGQVRALLRTHSIVQSSFSISGILRAPGQAGDIPFGSSGQLGTFPGSVF